ncbi:MAG: aminodeoxychorismate synthase component I [Pseudomonadota bacterium]
MKQKRLLEKLGISIRDLEYNGFAQAETIFSKFENEKGAILLSSGGSANHHGRFDIIVARPFKSLITNYSGSLICSQGNLTHSNKHGFDLLEQEWLATISKHSPLTDPQRQLTKEFPFLGGVVGYWSYDLGRYTENVDLKRPTTVTIPLMQIGFYDWAIIIDHQQQQSRLLTYGLNEQTCIEHLYQEIIELTFQETEKTFELTSTWESSLSQKDYFKQIDKIFHHIQQGDTYQINFTQCFTANFIGEPWAAFVKLNISNKAPFSAFLRLDEENSILCLSPERFLAIDDLTVITQPIKGTRPRYSDPVIDCQAAYDLSRSEKDRAENLMIVDLLRNDLGKVCVPGTIEVPQLFDICSFEAVHHMVSTITGKLKSASETISLLRQAFPGGSITGAPKKRAMEIIDELEPHNRSIFCGSIGYIDQFGNTDTNIAIRTLVCQKSRIYAWAGGGIVADSNAQDEYQESFDKLKKILPIL